MKLIYNSMVNISKTCLTQLSTCRQDEVCLWEKILSSWKIIFQIELSPLIKFKSEIPQNWENYSKRDSVLQAHHWIHLPNIWIQLYLFIRTKLLLEEVVWFWKISPKSPGYSITRMRWQNQSRGKKKRKKKKTTKLHAHQD